MTILLEVEDLSCTMGGVRALNDVSLTIREGSTFGVVGPNGAGKTTLFNAITGFVSYETGDIRWQGESIHGARPEQIANKGLMRTFQNAGGLSDLTVRENLLVAGRPSGESKIERIASLLNLADSLDTYVRDCSLASRKLVGIAMAVVRSPHMLMLDEPLAGLDTADRQAVTDVIRLIKELGVTVVLIEHDVDRVLELSDEVVILDVGKAVAMGSPDDLAGMSELRNVYLRA